RQRAVPQARHPHRLQRAAIARAAPQGRRVPHRAGQHPRPAGAGMAAGCVAGGGSLLDRRLLPAARRRLPCMTDALLFVHQVGARALVAFAVVLGIWGAYLYFRRDAVSGGFRSSFLIMAGLTAVQGLAGLGVFIAGQGWHVTVLDNLSRAGTDRNLAWLQENHGASVKFVEHDLRHYAGLDAHVEGQDAIVHMAGQVAVTTSLVDPIADFEINAR